MEKSLKEQAIKYANHFGSLLDVPCAVVDLSEKNYTPAGEGKPFDACANCPHKNCKGYEQFAYGCREAYRWDGLYTFHCYQEMVVVCASIASEKGDLAGGLVIGPIILDNKEELLAGADKKFKKALEGVSEYSPHHIQAMAEILAGIAGSISDLSHGRAGRYFYRQESLLNAMYGSRDKAGSQTLLNQILAHIYVSNNNNIEAIKPRITELIVVISRAAVDAGADINEIFLINENFTANIEEFTNLEDLSAWVSNMLQRFISFTFEFDKVKHADAVYKVIEYIKTNFRRHMSLEDIAASTYLSKTYLSSLFKKETGYSISEYINIVRIDRSKSLLMEENMSIIEIANLCGFEDQSYFTKVFRESTDMTPRRYRLLGKES